MATLNAMRAELARADTMRARAAARYESDRTFRSLNLYTLWTREVRRILAEMDRETLPLDRYAFARAFDRWVEGSERERSR